VNEKGASSAGATALPPFAKLYQGVQDPLNLPDELDKFLKAVLGAPWDSERRLIDKPFVGFRAMREEGSNRFFGRKGSFTFATNS
jgi:hypothetical protein